MDQKNHNIIEFKKLLISHKILNHKGLVINHEKKLIKSNTYDSLLKITSFLDIYNSSIRERLIYVFLEQTKSVLCKECNKNKTNIHKNKFLTFCSTKCSTLNKDVQAKLKKTNQTQYGVDCVFQNTEIQQKTKTTLIKKYGVDSPQRNKKIQQKTKTTNIERYGVENPAQNKNIQKKITQTNLRKYGVKTPLQHTEVKTKIKETNLKRYSVNNPSQKHIGSYNLQLLNNKEWLYLQHHIKKQSLVQIASKLNTYNSTINNYLQKFDIKVRTFNNSYTSIQWLVHIMHTENIHIQHAQNVGEYRIPNTRYYADGYCKETNTIYEYYGDFWHGNPKLYNPNDKPFPNYERTFGQLYEATVQKENIIKELGYNLIVKWETDD